jgi:hypothetical protein
MLTPGSQVIVEIDQTEPQKKVERYRFDLSIEESAPAFSRILYLEQQVITPSAQRNIDIEPTKFGCGYRRESGPDIGSATLASRPDDMAWPQALSDNYTNTVDRFPARVDQPAAYRSRPAENERLERLVKSKRKFFRCSVFSRHH